MALLVALTACGNSRSSSRPGAGSTAAFSVAQVASSPRKAGPSALRDLSDPRLPRPLVDAREIIAGGPPPDGIPALDRPRFEHVSSVRWLANDELVLAFSLHGQDRAYPVEVIIWHEIVNDTVAGVPVTITYCPLCNSAVAYDRRLGRRVLDFGTSGELFRSALVMYDLRPSRCGRTTPARPSPAG